MPHCKPMMNTRPQITSVEEMIRMPAWRSASPKKRNTLRRSTSPTMREPNLTISPNDSIQPRGVAIRSPISQPLHLHSCRASAGSTSFVSRLASFDDRGDLGMGREQRLRERVVEREYPEESDHDRLID